MHLYIKQVAIRHNIGVLLVFNLEIYSQNHKKHEFLWCGAQIKTAKITQIYRISRMSRCEQMTTELQVFDEDRDKQAEENQEIDQIRKLLFGEFENKYKERLANLETRFEQFEIQTNKQFQELMLKLNELSQDTSANQKASMNKLGVSIAELGNRIANMGQEIERVATDDKQPE